MRKGWIVCAWLTILGALAGVSACGSGSSGPAGPEGPAGVSGETGATGAGGPGPAGPAGAPGVAGAKGLQGNTGDAGPVLLVSSVAQAGIAASPVPVSLSGLSSDEIELVGNGSYLVNAVGNCTGCHTTAAGFLAGGVQFGGAGAPFTVTSRNLTPDFVTGLSLTLSEFVDVMRTGADYHGVADGGLPTTQLVVMPWLTYRWMSTYDIESIWWYLKAIPPQANGVVTDTKTVPAPSPAATAYTAGDQATAPALAPEVDGQGNPIPDPGSLLRGLAINPLTEVTPPADPTQQSLFARGSYLVNALADCSGCHTNIDNSQTGKIDTAAYLTGGQVFATPSPEQKALGTVRAASANLQGQKSGFFNLANVQFDTFLTAITQGIHAEDATADSGPPAPIASPMPWKTFRNMQASDLQAIYVYMNQVAVQYGSKTLKAAADKVIPSPALYCDLTVSCPSGMTCSTVLVPGMPGECLANACNIDTDCAVCQTCSSHACQVETGATLAACSNGGY